MPDPFDSGTSTTLSVRADTRGFARDIAAMRAELDGPLGDGAVRAGRAIEAALSRAVRTGKLSFEDLRRSALGVMNDIAGAAIRAGVGAAFGSGGGSAATGLATSLITGLLGLPGRATGGPVAPQRPYLVGERGPELFVPTASGSVHPIANGGGSRDVRVAITVNAAPGAAPAAMERSSRQIARAVRNALAEG